MENKINIAELLKDCPKGMELDCTMYENCTFEGIDDIGYTEILVKTPSGQIRLTKEGCFTHNDKYAKCIIFPKGKTTWEGFVPPCKFKDGDIVTCTNDACTYTAIFKEMIDKGAFCRYGVLVDNKFRCRVNDWSGFNETCRLATEEEKQKLFDAIKANGYKWNAETKTLEKLVEPKFKVGDVIQDIDTYKVKITEVNIEDECYGYESMIAKGIGSISFSEQDNWELVPSKFDINTLKSFESKVLVRDYDDRMWNPAFWGKYLEDSKYSYLTSGGCYKQCIPYEGNEHLLDKTDDFYKTQE